VIPTVLLLFAGGFLGMKLIKSAGTSIMGAVRAPIQPSPAMHGVGILAVSRVLSGLLFLIPGFFSDILAVLALLPPVQDWFRTRFHVETFSTAGAKRGQLFEERRFDTVIDGEAIEIAAEVEAPPSSGNGKG
jgi:UPF0716 family protein affecting phage T7 exclusion